MSADHLPLPVEAPDVLDFHTSFNCCSQHQLQWVREIPRVVQMPVMIVIMLLGSGVPGWEESSRPLQNSRMS